MSVVAYVAGDFHLKKFKRDVVFQIGLNEEGGTVEIGVDFSILRSYLAKRIDGDEVTPISSEDSHFTYAISHLPPDDNIRFYIQRFVNEVLYKTASIAFPNTLTNTLRKKQQKYPKGSFENELRSYIHVRGKKLADLMIAKCFALYRCYYGYDTDAWELLGWIQCRLRADSFDSIIFKARITFNDIEFKYFLHDMAHLNQGLCRYVVDRIDRVSSFSDYLALVKSAPKFIKKCRYPIRFTDDEIEFLDRYKVYPRKRIQYFYAKALASCDDIHSHRVITDLLKFINADLKEWHYFKEYNHYDKGYSTGEIHHLLRTVYDGYTIYENNCNNGYGVEFDRVVGSSMKMLQRAIFNHRQEASVRRRKLLATPDRPMLMPPVELPDWIEEIRLKTQHDLLIAGEECHHCIGNFTNSSDVFVREGNVCAQINRWDLTVGQCYDLNDKVTDASKDLKRRLHKALHPLKGQLSSAS